jgi:hypothetical protein
VDARVREAELAIKRGDPDALVKWRRARILAGLTDPKNPVAGEVFEGRYSKGNWIVRILDERGVERSVHAGGPKTVRKVLEIRTIFTGMFTSEVQVRYTSRDSGTGRVNLSTWRKWVRKALETPNWEE